MALLLRAGADAICASTLGSVSAGHVTTASTQPEFPDRASSRCRLLHRCSDGRGARETAPRFLLVLMGKTSRVQHAAQGLRSPVASTLQHGVVCEIG